MIAPPDWLAPDEAYLVGLSGGRDSVALFHWLKKHRFQNLTCCHLNHSLRGQESDGDESFVREIAGPSLLSQKVNVREIAETRKISLETAARQARHQFFEKCSHQTGCSKILLAHHADDQAETILFNLLRGSAGPKGIKPIQKIGSLTLLRPLLEVRRSDIDSFIEAENISYREDSSNADAFAVRNRLRHEALPLLIDIMGRDPNPALLRLQTHYSELDDYLETALSSLEILDPQGRIHLPTLKTLPVALQKKAIHHYLKNHHIPEISSDLIDRSLQIIDPQASPSINLPGGQRLRRKESRLFITP